MTRTVQLTCAGAESTQAVAAAVARTVLPGDVVLLDGDLGAGKTTFTQGLARGMGVGEVVTSPTFALVRSYPTAFGIELVHVDVYRLDRPSEIVALGLAEMLDDGAVAVVEWGGRAAEILGPDYLHVALELTSVDGERRLTLSGHGARWRSRWEEVAAAVSAPTAGVRW